MLRNSGKFRFCFGKLRGPTRITHTQRCRIKSVSKSPQLSLVKGNELGWDLSTTRQQQPQDMFPAILHEFVFSWMLLWVFLQIWITLFHHWPNSNDLSTCDGTLKSSMLKYFKKIMFLGCALWWFLSKMFGFSLSKFRTPNFQKLRRFTPQAREWFF